MAHPLMVGKHPLAFTAGVNDRIADDSEFSKFAMQSLVRFNRGDWGDVGEQSKQANDAILESLNNGGWDGRILAVYTLPNCYWRLRHCILCAEGCHDRRTIIYIIRNTAMEDGTQVITVMFPEDY